MNHTTVLLNESIVGLKIKSNGTYVDCTLGGGGHSSEICSNLDNKGTLIAIDQDEYAIARGTERLKEFECNKKIILDNFTNLKEILLKNKIYQVDGILMDLGVSSFQLDDAQRGFSYKFNSRLDMRMDRNSDFSAYEVVNTYSDKELFKVINEYGEEKFAWKIAKEIMRARKEKPVEDTFELVEIIKKAIPAKFRREGPHPAKRTFQAIRIEVNDELKILKKAVDDSVEMLKSGGRLCIITFHSLEDRIVKQRFKYLSDPCECPKDFPKCICGKKPVIKIVTKKPMYPSQEDIDFNPRARSAKLRIAEKL